MNETTGSTAPVEANYLEDWALRPWILAGLGALAGLVIHLILDGEGESSFWAAVASFTFFGFVGATFVLRPTRLAESAIFAAGLGLVMGGIAYLVAESTDSRAGSEFAFAAGVFFSLLAVPLFQAEFHRKRWATSYEETHFHCWTDAVSAGGALAFVGLSWLVLWLLHALFSIVGIELIEQLIEADGFAGAFIGATFGGAMGVLRNQLGIIGTLQRVVMLVFSLLAVPFAAALLIFLVILLTSGGSALWEATDSATPVLLSCAIAAFILTNAIVRDDDKARSSNPVMLAAALVLAACILPLTIFAAISMGIRIDQHGLAPARIWALIAIVIATMYGLAYWAGLIRGRVAGWSGHLRVANMRLAVASCVIAFILAFPIFDFGAISARDQLARLESGEVSAAEFDYAALRWEFGDAGREALAELAESDDAEIAQFAEEVELAEERWSGRPSGERAGVAESVDLSAFDEEAASAIRVYIRDNIYLCDGAIACRAEPVMQVPRGQLAALFPSPDFADMPRLLLITPDSDRAIEQRVENGRLRDSNDYADGPERDGDTLELRPFEGQQLYVGGLPAGEPFIAPETSGGAEAP